MPIIVKLLYACMQHGEILQNEGGIIQHEPVLCTPQTFFGIFFEKKIRDPWANPRQF